MKTLLRRFSLWLFRKSFDLPGNKLKRKKEEKEK